MRQINKNESRPFVLLALNTNQPDEKRILNAVGFDQYTVCEKVWNGQSEVSYAVFYDGLEQYQALEGLAITYNQDAILQVSADRDATLVNLKEVGRNKIGKFKAISKVEAISSGNYTYVSKIDVYYKAV